jgi:D-beta-D-heptose 7-phosphate kinase/D-beta-D-heptose 1-phosphate adenosyltransferase
MGRYLPDWKELTKALDVERAAKRRIVFTNGVFDMLHAGHVRSLAGAASLGDVLVVGVNDDASVRRLKGDKRPIMPLDQRAEILAALAAVAYVAPFAEDTPLELIRAVRPDVLVKGRDYAGKLVVGADFVEKNGGRVELLPLVEGVSTTDLVTEILRRYRGD